MRKASRGMDSALLVCILLTSILSASVPAMATGGRDASISVSADRYAQEVEKGDTAEYTITVRNTGSNPITVQLQAVNDQEGCNGYSSQVDQIAGPIDSGASETTSLRVNVTEGAADPCDTTVTVVANEQTTPPDPPGQSAQEELTVTTSVDGDESNQLWAVELETDNPSRSWSGDSMVTWEIEVKNKGRTNATISLEVQTGDANGCDPLELDATLSQTTVNVDNGSSEFVDLEVEVPEGQQAKKQCWNIHAAVSNDPQGNATDDLLVSLTIPELHECESELTDDLLSIDPDDTKSTTVTYTNKGNTEWTLVSKAMGNKASWVSYDGPSSDTIPYNSEDDTISFDFDVTADDSLNAGDEVAITIEGRDGNGPVKCSSDLTVRVGQSHGASVSLSDSVLSNIKPGENDTTDIIVSNQGNGQETMRVSVTMPDGWIANIDGMVISGGVGSTSVTVSSKHGSGDKATIPLEVMVPPEALADEVIQIPITVSSNSGGTIYDAVNVSVSVAAVHGMEVTTSAEDQTGKSNEEVYFPFVIENTGNTEDIFRLVVVSQTANPGWSTHFILQNGGDTPVTQIPVPARESQTAILVVKIEGEVELDNSRLKVRVTNTGDSNTGDEDEDGIPDNQVEMEFRAILSNQIFLMDIELDEEWIAENGGGISLAPGGKVTIPVWLINVGDYSDNSFVEASGLEGLGSLTMSDGDGNQVDDSILVHKGYGIRNLSTGAFLFSSDGQPVIFQQSPLCDSNCSDEKAWQYILDNDLLETHESKVYKVKLLISISISSNAENGRTGVVSISAASLNNMIEMESVSVTVTVNTVKKIGMSYSGSTEADTDYSTSTKFDVVLTNEGNTEFDIRVFTSDALRGWVLSLSEQDGTMVDGKFIANDDICDSGDDGELICTLDVGESVIIEIDVKPPHSSEVADTFEFTFSAEPEDTGLVGRKNMEFTVNGEPVEKGVFDDLPGFTGVFATLAMLGAAMMMQRRRLD